MQCQAKAKSTQQQCNRRAVNGKRVCTVHGGLTPGGIASPNYKTGKYSKYLPQDLLRKYEDASKDSDLLALREEIHLTDARLSDLIEKLDKGGGMEDWSRLSALWAILLSAQRDSNRAATENEKERARAIVADTMQNLDRHIRRGHENISLWHEIHSVIDERRKLVQTEAKRLADMQQMITAEKAVGMIYAFLDIVKTRVVDARLLSEISQDVRGLLTRTGSE